MFIIGERLQNFPNIENAAVIKVDWQSVWKSLSSVGFILFAENSSSSLAMIRSFELRWNDTERSILAAICVRMLSNA